VTITVYGIGCAKCRGTESIVRRAIAETGMTAEVVRVGDVRDIVTAGVLLTPAVAVDGVVKITGRVPSLKEVKAWITG